MLLFNFKRLFGLRTIHVSVMDQILFNGCNALTTILIARGLGPYIFGEYIFIWGLIVSLITLQWAFLITPMSTIGPKQEADKAHFYYGSVFITQLGCAIGLLVLVWTILIFQKNPVLHQMALPMAAATSFYSCQEFVRRYFFAIEASVKVLVTDIIGSAVQLVFLFYFFFTHQFTLNIVLWVVALTSLAAVIWGSLNAGKLAFHHHHVKKTLKRNLTFGSWSMGSMVSTTLFSQIEMILMKILLGAVGLGGVRAITNLGNLFLPISQGIQNVLVPKASKILETSGEPALKHFLLKSGSLSVLISFIILFPACLFRTQLVALAYGRGYSVYANLIVLQFLCNFINMIRIPFWIYLQTMEHVRFMFIFTTGFGTVSIGIMIVCMHYFQVQGVFIAGIINSICLLAGVILYIIKSRWTRQPSLSC